MLNVFGEEKLQRLSKLRILPGITHPSKRDEWVFGLWDVDDNVCGHLTRSGLTQNRNCESVCGGGRFRSAATATRSRKHGAAHQPES